MARCRACGDVTPNDVWCYWCEQVPLGRPSRFIVRTAAILSIIGWLIIGGALGMWLS